MNHYWLSGWLESNQVKDVETAKRLLGSDTKLAEMKEVADQWRDGEGTVEVAPRSLVAGTGLDFKFTCSNPPCRRHRVDRLFRKTWHYFDSIVVGDYAGHLLEGATTRPDDIIKEHLFGAMVTQLYLKELDAEDLVRFVPFPSRDVEHDLQAYDRLHNTIAGMARHAVEHHSTREETPVGTVFSIQVPPTMDPRTITVRPGDVERFGDGDVATAAATLLLLLERSWLLPSLGISRQLGLPFGLADKHHENILVQAGLQEAPPLALELPVLENVPIDVLIKLRQEHRDDFEAFRGALKKSLEAVEKEARSSKHRRDEIIADLLEPEIARIRRHLRGAKNTMARKSGTSLVLGSMATACGLMLGLPLGGAFPAGLGIVLAGVGRATNRYIEEQQEIEQDPMYFAMEAVGHAPPGH